jgi:trk system potassium uptake protein
LSGELRKSIAVIGLGRFGEAVAKRLLERGHDVLCIDRDASKVQQLADQFPHIVQANASEKDALEAIGVADVDIGVVAIGEDLEGSVLAVLSLGELGIKTIWAKAANAKHGLILEKLGVSKIVYPESEMGRALADQMCPASLP